MPELGFGAITEDLKILSEDSPSPEASSPEAPSATPEIEQAPEVAHETQTESADLAQPIGPEGQINEAELFKAYPQYKETFLTLKKNLAEHQKIFGTVREAREFKNQIQALGGLEKIKELRARTEQLDSVDKIYFGGNAEEKKQFLSGLQQQNPQAFFSAVMNGVSFLQKAKPEEFSYLIGPLVAEQLREANIWHWLEHIHNELRDKPELAGVSKLLNQFAQIFRKYGLGPSGQTEAPEVAERRSSFHAEIGRAAGESLDGDRREAIDYFAPHISSDAQLLAAVVDQAHLELQNAIKSDTHLRHALSNLLQSGISRSVGNKAANLLASKLRRYIPLAVQKIASEFPPPKAQPAAANGKAAPSRNGARKEKLTQRAANQMDFLEVLSDSREGEARK